MGSGWLQDRMNKSLNAGQRHPCIPTRESKVRDRQVSCFSSAAVECYLSLPNIPIDIFAYYL